MSVKETMEGETNRERKEREGHGERRGGERGRKVTSWCPFAIEEVLVKSLH
jgi:hypothetical protein